MNTVSPYPGLRPFQPEEADLFFGREAQVEDMLARLEAHRFLAVVGTSGCGKSSLVLAGLIPTLEQGFLSNAFPNWRIAITRPGSDPFANLTTALLQDSALGPERRADNAVALLEAILRRGPQGLVEAVAESNLPEDTNLLLLVDQFEEIFRYRQQAAGLDEADAFVSLLLAAALSAPSEVPIYVVITMRSDFIGDCALFTGLPEAINDSQFLTPKLTRDEYRAAIVEPAKAAKGHLPDSLVNRLLNDLRGEPDQLPLLQHLLMRMWTQASSQNAIRELTLLDYETACGLDGALSQHCDEILADLDAKQSRIAEAMFRALCERGTDQRDTRRPVKLGDVAAIAEVEGDVVKPVVDAFRGEGCHFLMPPISTPLEADTLLDISHESLIRRWQTLDTWVTAEAESARQYQRLEDVAERHQKGEAELWRGVDLHHAQAWKEREVPTSVWAARYGKAFQKAMAFLEQSDAVELAQQRQGEEDRRRELEQAQEVEIQKARADEQAKAVEQARELAEIQKARADEQAKNARRFQILAIVIGALLMATLGIAIYASYQQRIATKAQEQAERDKRQADVERVRAEQEQEKARLAAAEARWHQQRAEVRSARYFSAVARANTKSKPPLSVLLSLEAVKANPIRAAEEALRYALANIGGTPLVGYRETVHDLAFSPDSKRLAIASEDNTVRIWHVNKLQTAPAIFRGHEDAVSVVAFSSDGKRLATASEDNTVRIWWVNYPQASPTILKGYGAAVESMVFSQDSQRLTTVNRDKTVRIWYINSLQTASVFLKSLEGGVNDAAFSMDGQWLAIVSSDQAVRIWHVNDLRQAPNILRGHEDAVSVVAFSPDGQRLATASEDNTVRIWHVNDLRQAPNILRGHEDTVSVVAFSPDGQRLATASEDNTVRIWHVNDLRQAPNILRGHEDTVSVVAFSPDGKQLASASRDKMVRIWWANNPQASPTILNGHEGGVHGVAFSPDGKQLATANEDNTVRIWSVNDPQLAPSIVKGHEDAVYDVAFSPDGQRLATASSDKTVRIWWVDDLQATPILLKGHEDAVFGVAFSPDGQQLATASSDKSVRIWWVNNLQATPILFQGHEDAVFGVAFSPDGQQLATASLDKTVRIWWVNDPQAAPTILGGYEGGVYGVAFSPDGQRLATTSSDKTVRIWWVNDPQAAPTILKGHEDTVIGVAFSPDGQRLATASFDKTVRIWWVNDPQAAPTILKGHEALVYGLAFSPDGRWLATTSFDNMVFIWSVDIEMLTEIACNVVSRNFNTIEWDSFLGDEPYRKTCLKLPLSSDFIIDIRKEIEKGLIEIDDALLRIEYALQPKNKFIFNTFDQAKKLIVPALLEIIQNQILNSDIDAAIALFKRTLHLDPSLNVETKYANALNSLCWFGALDGFAVEVLDACNKAVALLPDYGEIRDTRGYARTLSGNFTGAIADFEFYIQWARNSNKPFEQILQREAWINKLKANENPFTPELLQQLREQ